MEVLEPSSSFLCKSGSEDTAAAAVIELSRLWSCSDTLYPRSAVVRSGVVGYGYCRPKAALAGGGLIDGSTTLFPYHLVDMYNAVLVL
jgi:hypothetical protein